MLIGKSKDAAHATLIVRHNATQSDVLTGNYQSAIEKQERWNATVNVLKELIKLMDNARIARPLALNAQVHLPAPSVDLTTE